MRKSGKPFERLGWCCALLVGTGCACLLPACGEQTPGEAQSVSPNQRCASFQPGSSSSLGAADYDAIYYQYDRAGHATRRDWDTHISGSIDAYEINTYDGDRKRVTVSWAGVPQIAPSGAGGDASVSAVFRPVTVLDSYEKYTVAARSTYQYDDQGRLATTETDVAMPVPLEAASASQPGTQAVIVSSNGELDGSVDVTEVYEYTDDRVESDARFDANGALISQWTYLYTLLDGRIETREAHYVSSAGVPQVTIDHYSYNPDGSVSEIAREYRISGADPGLANTRVPSACVIRNTYNADQMLASVEGCGQHAVHLYGQQCGAAGELRAALAQFGLEITAESAASGRPIVAPR